MTKKPDLPKENYVTSPANDNLRELAAKIFTPHFIVPAMGVSFCGLLIGVSFCGLLIDNINTPSQIVTPPPTPVAEQISQIPPSPLPVTKSVPTAGSTRKPPTGEISGMHRLERHTESRDYLEFGEFRVNFPESPIERSKDGGIYPGQSEEVHFLIANKYGDKVRVGAVCKWNGDNEYIVSSINYQTIDGTELPTSEATIIKHAHQVCAN
jgi:hypothetical protein